MELPLWPGRTDGSLYRFKIEVNELVLSDNVVQSGPRAARNQGPRNRFPTPIVLPTGIACFGPGGAA